jgi:hypothetical protein
MKIESGLDLDPKMHAALDELAGIISQHYPDSTFRVSRGEDDPTIVQLVAVVDVEDTDPVLDLVMDRMLELHDEDLLVFVVTERPIERTVAMREAALAQRPAAVPAARI